MLGDLDDDASKKKELRQYLGAIVAAIPVPFMTHGW
jgi:hypothetical protein